MNALAKTEAQQNLPSESAAEIERALLGALHDIPHGVRGGAHGAKSRRTFPNLSMRPSGAPQRVWWRKDVR